MERLSKEEVDLLIEKYGSEGVSLEQELDLLLYNLSRALVGEEAFESVVSRTVAILGWYNIEYTIFNAYWPEEIGEKQLLRRMIELVLSIISSNDSKHIVDSLAIILVGCKRLGAI